MLTPTAFAEDHHPPYDRQSGLHLFRPAAFSRRDLLGASLGLGATLLTVGMLPAYASVPKVTAEEIMGPFYPLAVPADHDADLTRIAGRNEAAKGQVVYVSGRVTDAHGRPLDNAVIEVWQANAVGRYAHPADSSKAAVDPDFQGFAIIRTRADGSYNFKTIKPGAYPTGDGDWSRPPHIHFDVRGRKSRVVTQMYFEGEPLNAKDRLLQKAQDKETMMSRLVAPTARQERDALVAVWDIVLQTR